MEAQGASGGGQLPCRAVEFEAASCRWFDDSVHDLMRARDGLYAELAATTRRVEQVPESVVPFDDGGPEMVLAPIAVRAEGEFSVRRMLDGDFSDIYVVLDSTADTMLTQTMTGAFAILDQVTERTGNSVDANGRDMVDTMIEGLEKVDVKFDDEGKPTSMWVMHPDTAEKLRAQGMTQEQADRLDAMMVKKREAWRASRRSRRLA